MGYLSTGHGVFLLTYMSLAVPLLIAITSGSSYDVWVVFPYVSVRMTLAAYLKSSAEYSGIGMGDIHSLPGVSQMIVWVLEDIKNIALRTLVLE